MSVGASLVEVSPPIYTARRNALVITNTSTAGQIIYLSWEKDAVVGIGIVLYPAGTHSESFDGYFVPSLKRITAIANAAGGTIAVHERLSPQER